MPSGGYRPGAGRPRKNLIDKKLEGKPAKLNGMASPRPRKIHSKHVMADYFSMAMKAFEREVTSADLLRSELKNTSKPVAATALSHRRQLLIMY